MKRLFPIVLLLSGLLLVLLPALVEMVKFAIIAVLLAELDKNVSLRSELGDVYYLASVLLGTLCMGFGILFAWQQAKQDRTKTNHSTGE